MCIVCVCVCVCGDVVVVVDDALLPSVTIAATLLLTVTAAMARVTARRIDGPLSQ